LRDAIRASGNRTARQVIRHIDRQVRAFTGAFPQSDDITLIALGRT
jgi:hypothetical protein